MKVDLVIDGAEVKTELLGDPPACRFRFDGTEFPVDVEMPEPGIYSVLLDGHSYDASVERTDRLLIVTVNGQRFEIEVRDSRRWLGGSGRAEREGHETLIAPMPGKVVRVLAAIGDAVEPGQGVIVVEAMKMQNEIKASRSGRVLTIHAREGTTVTAGEALASIG